MAKIVFAIGLDVDLYEAIENVRENVPRASFINEKLRSVMSGSLPQHTDTTTSMPNKEMPACQT